VSREPSRGIALAAGICLVLAATLVLVSMLAGCGGSSPARDSAAAPRDWPFWGGSPENTHYAAHVTISAANAGRLRRAWQLAEGPQQRGWETFPVVVGRTMYITTNTDQVRAVDAVTGRVLWNYTPMVDFVAAPGTVGADPTSRGVAVGAGRVYDLTYDDHLVALDASTGAVLWSRRVANPSQGDAENSPGTYWNGEVIVGGPAGDSGRRGFVAAYDARTGTPRWRTYVVPAPGHGWVPAAGTHGGGDVWMPPVVDPGSGIVYAATGNPTPALSRQRRPGCDRWSDATIALNARTGTLLWGHSELCNDAWDYDTDQAPMIFDLRVHGGVRRVVGDASKAGFYSILDARSGALVSRTPELVRFSEPHGAPTTSGALICPGIFGGIEYGPAAYSPRTGSVYVVGSNACERYRASSPAAAARHRPGTDDLAGTVVPVGPVTGMIDAIDPATGRVRWRRSLPSAAVGGVLATAGGLVFTGDDDGELYAFDARTGDRIWKAHIGLRFGSAPIAYTVAGHEYLAVAAGGSGFAGGRAAPSGGRLQVFELGS
jgi:alcohol dehydrogenase (cytochrome c)